MRDGVQLLCGQCLCRAGACSRRPCHFDQALARGGIPINPSVIPREQSDRGNPHQSIGHSEWSGAESRNPHLKKEIATPVCALARNDR